MKHDATSPETYTASVPLAQRPLFDHLRALARDGAPRANEVIRWGMLCWDDGGALFALAAQKQYVSLYVMATEALRLHAAALENVDHGKGCLRFRKLESVPTEALRHVIATAASLRERECQPVS